MADQTLLSLPAATQLAVEQAIAALRAGEAVVFPTETFYGLGVDACSKKALERLFAIKQRDPTKPVGLIIADLEVAREVAAEIPPIARKLAERFWPGPLTIVLPARASLAAELLGPTGGVAVRVSSNPIAHALARSFGRPITATSANLSGQPPARTIEQAREAFGDKVAVYVDGGYLDAELASTVVSLENDELRIWRHGAISERALREALGEA